MIDVLQAYRRDFKLCAVNAVLLSCVPSYPLTKDTLTQFLAYRSDIILKGDLNLKGAADLMVYVTKAA